MKYCVILPDGMADEPLPYFGGLTPMEGAHKPNMDKLAREGLVGMVATVQDNFSPGSDVANLGVLGYDTNECYTGRAPFEAAANDLKIDSDEVVFRCNLVTTADGVMQDHSGGGLKPEEGARMIADLQAKLGSDRVRFEVGVAYRHLMIVKGMDHLDDADTTPPHDILTQPLKDHLPKGKDAEFLQDLMAKSHDILKDHEINQVRVDLGENPANMIWLWGQGKSPVMKPFADKYGLKGAMISAVDLLNGIAKLIDFDVINVEGATGYFDTNYAGKAEAAIKALDDYDFVFVHIEAPDEEGHSGNALLKMRAIELIDKHIVGPLAERAKQGDLRLMVLPDHPTPIHLRTHTRSPVPFIWSGAGIASYGAEGYSEKIGADSGVLVDQGFTLMEKFIKGIL